ncbi:zeaxanthin epoxidase, chloroplastic isoform X1 [Amborella trichopoda]|nr:zeaxanthin epoxidase, chloroplastic isoform X1 [Amborella trichopoda]|eukprot:XP_020518965.1 zeaxanthin epoxidase, chloroplastic isoform X1 [Amborella trichopoda]
MSWMEEEIVIVGGGIIGLATALGLHRHGVKSLVLERGELLRSEGAALAMWTNGWRALDALGVGDTLRLKSIPIQTLTDVWFEEGRQRSMPSGRDEVRCLKRSDLMETLGESLPPETIRFNCKVVGVTISPFSHSAVHLENGTTISAKVVLGCDGVNSAVAKSLGLRTPNFDSFAGIRGFTSYSGKGHCIGNQIIRLKNDGIVVGRLPVDHNLVHWFISRAWVPQDCEISKEPKLIKEAALGAISKFPDEITEMVKSCDQSCLSLTQYRPRPPWELLVRTLHKHSVTLAGDAMHAMGPYTGQGCAVGLEDSVVLGRCLGLAMRGCHEESEDQTRVRISMALERYVKERKMRVIRMASQTYLVGLLAKPSFPPLKLVVLVVLLLFFGGLQGGTQYDCGTLLSPKS